MSRPPRSRFEGEIAGLGSASGVRVVVGRWQGTPWGPFADAMVERPDGRRVLLAPDDRVADLLAGTYVFDEVRVEPFAVTGPADAWAVRSPSLTLDLATGARTSLGVLLRAVPRPLATSPAWCAITDPVARVVLRGVRTRGTARAGRREWYAATDHRVIISAAGSFDGAALGELRPVLPAPSFGFSSTPPGPSVTTVVSTIEDVP